MMSETIKVNGAELAYIEQGQGDTVVFVHGGIDDMRCWRGQMEAFSKHYRAIAYSRRYHYPNAWTGTGEDDSAILHAEDLAALITERAPGPVHVIGASYGALTALFLAVKHPDLVRTLTLGEPPVLQWLKDIPDGATLWAAFVTDVWEPVRRAFRDEGMEAGVRCFVEWVAGAGVFDQLPVPVRTIIMDNAPELKAATSAPDYFAVPARADVGRIKVPTLLLTGELSPRLFHLITDELERIIPDITRVVIPDVGHPLQTNVKVYNETVLAFLAKHRS